MSLPTALLAASFLLLAPACDKGPVSNDSQPAEATTSKTVEATSAPALDLGVSGTRYGAGVSATETVSISELSKDPEAYEGKTVQVEGMVTDVCVKRGCWFEMAGEAPGEKVLFKVTDGEMVFPVDAKGKWAVAQGTIVTQKLTVDEARERAAYYAKDSGREFDPASITEGTVSFRIQGTGAVIGDKK